MATKLTRGTAAAGAFRGLGSARGAVSLSATVARTDTAAKNLFKLPAGAILDLILIAGTVASNAATTAVIDVGKTGTGDFFVADHDVKSAGKGDAANPAVTKNAGAQGGVQVTGTYAETGTASTAGGPWTVTALFHF